MDQWKSDHSKQSSNETAPTPTTPEQTLAEEIRWFAAAKGIPAQAVQQALNLLGLPSATEEAANSQQPISSAHRDSHLNGVISFPGARALASRPTEKPGVSHAQDSLFRLSRLVSCIETEIGSLDDPANAYYLAQLLLVTHGLKNTRAMLEE